MEQVLAKKYFIYRLEYKSFLEDIQKYDNGNMGYNDNVNFNIEIQKMNTSELFLKEVDCSEINLSGSGQASFFSEKEILEHFNLFNIYPEQYTFLPKIVYVNKEELRKTKIKTVLDD